MSAYRRYGAVSSNEALKAALFGLGLLGLLIGSFVMALSSGPIILGTEMNANGLVEYLCLGSGCERLYAMN